MKQQNEFKKQSKIKAFVKKSPLLSVVILMSLLLSGGVLALWSFSWVGNITLNVDSDTPIEFLASDFGVFNCNSTNFDCVQNNSLTLRNNDGVTEFRVLINLSQTDIDLEDGCSVEVGDCEILANFQGSIISNDDLINVPSGDSDFTTQLTALKRSCPMTCEVEVQLLPTEFE